MNIRLSVDRVERGRPAIAVLLTDNGFSINVPKALLPRGVKPGDVLSVSIDRDLAATKKISDETRKVQDDLKATDPGGDIKL